MAKYRDEVEAARLRADTLEAELKERGAELKERDAALAARDAKIRELEAKLDRQPGDVEPPPPAQPGRKMALVAGAIAAVAAVVAIATVRKEESTSAIPPVPIPPVPAELPAAPPTPEPTPPPEPAPLPELAPDHAGAGTVNINSIPPASVVVDGEPRGQTPVIGLSLKPGPHAIVLRHPEHGTRSRTITVEANKTSTVAIRF